MTETEAKAQEEEEGEEEEIVIHRRKKASDLFQKRKEIDEEADEEEEEEDEDIFEQTSKPRKAGISKEASELAKRQRKTRKGDRWPGKTPQHMLVSFS